MEFENTLVVPFTHLLGGHDAKGKCHVGGPIWTDWDKQISARHCRGGVPCDAQPLSTTSSLIITEPTVWAGPIAWMFGHQVADFSTRIARSIDQWPKANILFGVPPKCEYWSFHQLPGFFREIVAWFGIPMERLKLLKQPAVFRKLFVTPQGEQLGGPGPDEKYLDRLDSIVNKKFSLKNGTGAPLYVSRAAQIGRVAGENYLEGVLLRTGCSVIRPEALPLDAQLSAYINAERLIFSEGSAVHGVQLMGRLNKPIDIIQRRPGSRIANYSLGKRTPSLRYHNVIRQMVSGLWRDGVPALDVGIAIPHEEALISFFESLGLPVSRAWSTACFQEAVSSDVCRWVEGELASPRSANKGSVEEIKRGLSMAGFRGGLLDCE